MTQIEKKLNKLPSKFRKRISGFKYTFELLIKKEDDTIWVLSYKSKEYDTIFIEISHESLQAAVDTMLSELKKVKIIQ